MASLFRPAIPIEVKCRVLLRQLGEMSPDKVIEEWRPSNRNRARNLTLLHGRLICRLADLLKCDHSDLQLDHDPALALRERTGEGKQTIYTPAANDPEYLAYRPHGAEHEGSHDVKTRIRGDHGQFSDIALIKRERRRQKKAAAEAGFVSRGTFGKTKQKIRSGKTKWPKRSFAKRRK